ncbi:MAG: multidrug effflux MFS transporter, partial [Antricoccus sp.]
LGALSAVGPLSLDMYIPSFPQLASDLGVDASQAQISMTACMIGLAVGQLIAGIFSDSLGRRKPLSFGIGMFLVFSIACVFAPNIWLLILARFLQGVGGGSGVVIARAVVRDRFAGDALVKMLATVMMLLGLAPILAPILGGLLTEVTNWRGIFAVLSGLALALLIGSTFLPESLPPERRRNRGFGPVRADFAALLRDRMFLYGAGAVAFVSGGVFIYIAGSSFIFQRIYHFTPLQYSIAFAINGTGFVLFTQLNRILPPWLTSSRRQTIAIGGVTSAALLIGIAAIAPSHPLWLVLPGCFLTTASHGFGSPNGIAIALQNHGARAGSASALQGLTQFTIGAIAVPFAGESLTSVSVAIGVCAVCAITLRVTVGRGIKLNHPSPLDRGEEILLDGPAESAIAAEIPISQPRR